MSDGMLFNIFLKLECIEQKLDVIMSALDDANAALSKINDATNKQAAALSADGDLLQKVSDEMDAFIAQAQAGTLTPDLIANMQARADAVQAVSDSLDAHSAALAAIAAKGAANPVPVTPPPATPVA